jgi:hypothetical protein
MAKKSIIFTAAAVALALICQGAQAEQRHVDKRIAAVSLGVGVASSAAFFSINHWHWKNWNVGGLSRAGAWGITTVGCAAISPMVATAVLKRPLTQREAGILLGSCVVPIIGGWLVNAAYEAHPDWDPAYKPPRPRRMKHAKM